MEKYVKRKSFSIGEGFLHSSYSARKDTESPFIACLRGISAAKDAIRAA